MDQLQSFMLGGQDIEHQQAFSWKEIIRNQQDMEHQQAFPWKEIIRNPCQWRDRSIASEQTIRPQNVTDSLSALRECGKNRDLARGAQLHNELQKQGLDFEKFYADALVTMYARCGDLRNAQALLDAHDSSSVIAWSALISSYVREGRAQHAMDCFARMRNGGASPNAVTFVSLLKACGMIRDLERGKQIHHEISSQGLLEQSVVLAGALVDMYAKCGALLEARNVLQNLRYRNVIIWNALITGYVHEGQGQQALECFEQMHQENIVPNAVTYVCILKACALHGLIDRGKQVHDEISRQGLLEHSVVLGGALVDMYARCGALSLARNVLVSLPCRNAISWSSLIGGYTQNNQGQQALDCFVQMQREGISPDSVTYLSVLKACAMTGAIGKGKQIHDEILTQGLLKDDAVLGNALVDMYAKCGALPQAQSVLEGLTSRDVACWSSLIAGYAQIGQGQQALDCFEQMQREGISPDVVTYVCLLNGCAVIGNIDKGTQIHEEISRKGLLDQNVVLGGALVDMYVKCSALPLAQRVLEKLSFIDAISWNALIAGYAEEGHGEEALECFKAMQLKGIRPDAVTYLNIVKACAAIGAIDKGKQIHDEVLGQGFLEHDLMLGNALVDMYAKCGHLSKAQSVLLELPMRDHISWNSLIVGYSQEGDVKQSLECFEQMRREGIAPDIVTFRCLLNMCSHLGLVQKAQEIFDYMQAVYNFEPDLDCFTCIVDLLGRAGNLAKAVELIQEMPSSGNLTMWNCLLGACQRWVDVNVGTWAFEQVLELNKVDGAAYVMMGNIFAAAGMPEKVRDIEAMRIKNDA